MKKLRTCTFLLAMLCLLSGSIRAEEPKYAALTFDDGPAGRITSRLLDGLRERNLKATFFLCCYRMEQYPDLVRQMAADGHEIGIHGCSHTHFTKLKSDELKQELRCTASTIRRLTGSAPYLLRPPGGLYNENVRKLAEKEGLCIILWSLDPEDWDPAKRQKTAFLVADRIHNGDIVLLHDLSAENVKNALAAADSLTAQGWTFCTVSELAKKAGCSMEPGMVCTGFP